MQEQIILAFRCSVLDTLQNIYVLGHSHVTYQNELTRILFVLLHGILSEETPNRFAFVTF